MSTVKVLFISALALTFKCGFSTSWYSKDVYSATAITPITPTMDNQIGIINGSDIMTFRMDITIKSFPDNQWSNIFHFGNNNTEPLPGIWLYNNTLGLHICMSNINTWNDCENVQIPGNLQTDIRYSLTISYTQSSLVISLNNVTYVENYNYPSHTVLTDQAIYAGDPWSPSANVLIQHLTIQIPADLCVAYADIPYPEYIEGGLFAYSGSFNGKPYYQNVGGSQSGGGWYIYYRSNHWQWYYLFDAWSFDWTTNDAVDTGLGATWYYPMIISAKLCGHCDSNPTQNLEN